MDDQHNESPDPNLLNEDFVPDSGFEDSRTPTKVDRFAQIKSNFPTIALLTGVALFIFLASATVGLFTFVLMNRPTPEEKIEQVDLTGITSDILTDAASNEANGIEVVEGSAPGLFKVERTKESSEIVSTSVAPATNVLPGKQTFTNLSILPELPSSYYENRLRKNVSSNSAPPSLEHDGLERSGPQRVQFIIGENGNLHDHNLGTASFAETEIVGAAGEWQVRPWWQPGWIPQTVDCGEQGTVAIGGHVSWQSRPGPFHDLGAMTAGDRIRCQSFTGEWFTYEVSEVVQIGYNNTDYYWETISNLNDHQLTLFTCKPEITGIIVVRAQLVRA